ncbi:MAG: site-2 protease family protein [Candidatus Bathyarchaeota archaeon]|nr:site-2 protease family protein [Candidatus Bathyarchaeota archaeon]
MKYSFKIGSAWGIPIELHVTFILLIVAVFGLSLYSALQSGNVSIFSPYFYTFFLVLFLFVFVVFHELAHSVVARHYGIQVRKIVLYPIGGVSEIEEIPDNPAQEWRMAIAGPLTSLAIGAIFLVIALIVSPQLLRVVPLLSTTGNFLFDIASLNLLLGFFNLIPAFPMDGGRVFRALLAERMKYSDATRLAVTIGRIFGIVMVIAGFVFPNYFLLILVGIFVYIGASEEGEQTIISTKLAGVRIRDVMQSEVGYVSPQQTIAEAIEVMFKKRYHDVLVIKDGNLIGVVSWNELMKVDPGQRGSLRVEQMPLKHISIFEDEAILEANKIMVREKIDLIPVVDREAPLRVVGVLTSEAMARAFDEARNR